MRTLGALGVWLLAVTGLAGCQDEFPLGSWGQPATAGQGGVAPTSGGAGAGDAAGMATTAGTAGTAGGIAALDSPSCGEVGVPGPLNASGAVGPNAGNIGTTSLYTDWSWPAPVDSLEWDLVLEIDPENDGYYWAHQFSFVNGLTAFFGLQAHGGFQLTTDGKVDFVKMALFWVSSQRTAELGDVQGEDARVLVLTTRGVAWTTINAKFEWNPCTVYRLRVARDGTAPSGDVWYGAWVEDRTTTVVTKIGRIGIPADWGQISRLSTTLTTRIDDKPPPVTTCDQPEPASAIFGTPSGNDGQLLPTPSNRFASPLRCPSSRFTVLPEGVRHEIGVK